MNPELTTVRCTLRQTFTALFALFFTITAHAAPPANNDLADFATISGVSGMVSATNVEATKETGEPNHAGNSGGASIWFEWTAPADGVVNFNTIGSNFDTTLAVYSGTDFTDFVLEASDDDGGPNATSALTFSAVDGVTYYIAVDGFGGGTGSITLRWAVELPPPNDAFANAEAITGATGSVARSNNLATKEVGEPNHAAAGGASAWFAWTAPSNGSFSFDTDGSSIDTLLAVYTGSAVNALTVRGSNDNPAGAGTTARVIFTATAGTVYRIAVDGTDGAGGATTGDFVLSWNAHAAPANDNFASGRVINGATGVETGSTVGATKQANEPSHAATTGGRSVWFRWTAPSTGLFAFNMAGTNYDSSLAIYTGTTFANIVEETSALGEVLGGFPAKVNLQATAGAVYRIAVDGWESGTASKGNYSLAWAEVFPPANDDFSAAAVLTGRSGNFTATTLLATAEVGEPDHGFGSPSKTIWYRWVAPADGELTLYVDDFNGGLSGAAAVYTGAAVDALTAVPRDGITNRFSVVVGGTYYFAFDTGVDQGDVNLVFTLTGVNDSFAGALELTGAGGSFADSNVGATTEVGEPSSPNGFGSTMWYRWTAPADGPVAFVARGVEDMPVAGFTGTDITDITPVNTLEQGVDDAIAFNATQGVEYFIRVDSFDFEFPENFTLEWVQGPPANDDLAGAEVISGATGQVAAVLLGATVEAGDDSFYEGTVFYRWTAPAAGVFRMTSGENNLSIEVVTGSGANPFDVSFYGGVAGVSAGQVVTLRVAGYGVYYSKVNLSYQFTAGASLFDLNVVNHSPLLERVPTVWTLEVTRTAGVTTNTASVTISDVATGPGRAVLGTDYTLSTTALTFSPGEIRKLVTLTVINNALADGDRFVNLALVAGSNAVIGDGELGGTIYDDEGDPANNRIGSATVAAGTSGTLNGTTVGADPEYTDPGYTDGGNGSVFGVLNNSAGDNTVWYQWTAQATGPIVFSAEFFADFQGQLLMGVFDGTTAVAPEVARATYDGFNETISARAGWLAEAGKTYHIVVSGLAYSANGPAGTPFTLAWSAPSAGIVSVSNVTATEGVDAEATVTITRSGGTAAFSVDLEVNGYEFTGLGELNWDDVTGIYTTVNFGVGEMVKTVAVTVTDDAEVEGPETGFIVLYDNGSNLDVFVEPSFKQLTILDVDAGVMAFSAATASVGENAGTATLTVSRTLGSIGAASVVYTVTAGSATAADVTLASGTVNFLNGETSKTISVTLLEDTVDELDETFTVRLSAPSFGATLGAQATATVTIVDNDVPGELAFSAATYSVVESGTATLTVLRTNGTDGAISVNFATSAGTATAGEDFTGVSGTLSFAHGQASKTILVPVVGEGFDEANETFTVTLSAPTAGASLGTPATATVTITDDDTFAAKKTTFTGLLMQAGVVKGTLTVKETLLGKVTAVAIVGAKKATFSGTLGVDGSAVLLFKKKGSADQTLTLRVSGDAFAGTLNDGTGNVYTFGGNENAVGTKTAPVGTVGKYTALLQTRTAPNGGLLAIRFPQGDGWVSITVGVNGATKMKGKLAEGTGLSFSGVLDETGRLPVFVPLYKAKAGAIGFTLVFDSTQTQTDATANAVHWVKPAALKDKVYPQGWPGGITADLFASKFIAPAKVSAKNPTPPFILGTHNVLGLAAPTNITLALTDGATGGLSNDATVDAKNAVTIGAASATATGATKLAAKLKTSGALSGSFTHPSNAKAVKFSGVILQKTHTAGGYFLAPDGTSGAVSVAPKP